MYRWKVFAAKEKFGTKIWQTGFSNDNCGHSHLWFRLKPFIEFHVQFRGEKGPKLSTEPKTKLQNYTKCFYVLFPSNQTISRVLNELHLMDQALKRPKKSLSFRSTWLVWGDYNQQAKIWLGIYHLALGVPVILN